MCTVYTALKYSVTEEYQSGVDLTAHITNDQSLIYTMTFSTIYLLCSTQHYFSPNIACTEAQLHIHATKAKVVHVKTIFYTSLSSF